MVSDFNYGFVTVKLNGKYNYIDKNGKLLSDKWFDEAFTFYGDFTMVELNGKWYKIDKHGVLTEF